MTSAFIKPVMEELTNISMPGLKHGNGVVSILDESLFTGEPKQYKIFCTADPGFISIAAVDVAKNRFAGFEGFHFDKLLPQELLAEKISALTLKSSILKKVDFRNVSVLFGGARFTFIPTALFKEADAQDFFYFNHQPSEKETIHIDRLPGYDAVNVFAIPVSLQEAFGKLFEKYTVHHQLSAIMESARLYSSKHSSTPLFIHMHSSSLDIVVLKDRKLQLANSFSFKTVDDAIYYVMMVCEQLAMNPENTEVILAGEVENEHLFTRQLGKFFKHLSFAEASRMATFTYGFDQLPGHFYHSAFSHLLCES
jgi:hypothetical protein